MDLINDAKNIFDDYFVWSIPGKIINSYQKKQFTRLAIGNLLQSIEHAKSYISGNPAVNNGSITEQTPPIGAFGNAVAHHNNSPGYYWFLLKELTTRHVMLWHVGQRIISSLLRKS